MKNLFCFLTVMMVILVVWLGFLSSYVCRESYYWNMGEKWESMLRISFWVTFAVLLIIAIVWTINYVRNEHCPKSPQGEEGKETEKVGTQGENDNAEILRIKQERIQRIEKEREREYKYNRLVNAIQLLEINNLKFTSLLPGEIDDVILKKQQQLEHLCAVIDDLDTESVNIDMEKIKKFVKNLSVKSAEEKKYIEMKTNHYEKLMDILIGEIKKDYSISE